MAGVVGVIWVSREAEYFCGGDWAGQITLKLLMKIDLSRKIDFRARQLFIERSEQSRSGVSTASANGIVHPRSHVSDREGSGFLP
jgi:hypothetical protein